MKNQTKNAHASIILSIVVGLAAALASACAVDVGPNTSGAKAKTTPRMTPLPPRSDLLAPTPFGDGTLTLHERDDGGAPPGDTGGGDTGGGDTGGGDTVGGDTGGGDTGGGDTGGGDTGGGVVDDGHVARPASVLGRGFFVSGGGIYDKNGVPFVARGINTTHWWGDEATNAAAIAELPKTGANVVRVVFGPNMGADQPGERRDVVAAYAAQRMPVIVEDHRGTCGTDPQQIVDITNVWLDPTNVAWLNEYEESVILNIANEWGPHDGNVWASTYETAIQRLRAAGVHNLILLDSGGGCGQEIDTIQAKAAEVEAADPEHNTAFSIHMYGFWRTSEAHDLHSWSGTGEGAPYSIRDSLTEVKNAGIPIIAGEIGFEQDSQVAYRTHEALQTFQDLGIGWIAWSWNQNSDATYNLVNNVAYDSPADLTAGGAAFVLDDNGIENTSIPTTTFDP